MTKLRVSKLAEEDLDDIAAYTVSVWGVKQSAKYVASLEDKFVQLAEMPSIGRSADKLRRGLRRMEEGSHVIFYTATRREILIRRVLHKAMIPNRRQI